MTQAIFNYFMEFLVLIAALRTTGYAPFCPVCRLDGQALLARIAPVITHVSLPLHRALGIVFWNG